MKAKVKSIGKTVEVEPNYYNGEIISWTHVTENGHYMYLPNEVEVDVSEMEQELTEAMNRGVEEAQSKMKWVPCSDECSEIKLSEVNWKEVEIRAALHALSACIIAGKKDAAKSAVYYAKQLVEELKL